MISEQDIKNLLLPRERYSEESKRWGRNPFTFEIEKDRKVLYYFGANHSSDPNNHQYPALREYWKKFLKVSGKDRIVLVEGGLRPVAESEQEAIEKGSEGSWVTYFANKENIPVACPDMSTEEFLEMNKEVDKDEWFLTENLRKFDYLQRSKRKMVLPEGFKELYKKYIGKDFDENENQNNLVNPNRNDAVTNKLSRMHSDLREVKIVSEIERYWKEGKSIFIAFGSGHLVIQKPALKALLK